MSGLVTEAIPHAEGIAMLKQMPAVTRRVFDQLLPELRGLAFTVSGIEAVDVLQNLRDTIAGLPQGVPWETVKQTLINDLSPWFIDPDADEEEQAKQIRATKARAELLMRLHGYNAYEAAHVRTLQEMGDIFTHWRWQTMGDDKVRQSHAAFDGLTLPNDSPFWKNVWPVRGYLCRCMLVGITPEEVEEDKAAERKQNLAPEKSQYPEGPALRKLEQEGIISRGPDKNFRLFDEKGPKRVLGHMAPDLQTLKDRYDPDVWKEFERFAKRTEISEGQSVWTWLGGKAGRTAKKAAKQAATAALSTTVTEALAIAGIDATAGTMTREQALLLLEELKEDSPATEKDVISSIAGAGPQVEAALRNMTEAFLAFVPRSVAKALPKLALEVKRTHGSNGYWAGDGRVVIGNHLMDMDEMRRVVFHELGHWLHMNLPGDHLVVKGIKARFEQRTKGERIRRLEGYGVTGKRDQWWEAYMGRIYRRADESTHLGVEVPSRCLELLMNPARFAQVWNTGQTARDDISLVLQILYPEAKP